MGVSGQSLTEAGRAGRGTELPKLFVLVAAGVLLWLVLMVCVPVKERSGNPEAKGCISALLVSDILIRASSSSQKHERKESKGEW